MMNIKQQCRYISGDSRFADIGLIGWLRDIVFFGGAVFPELL